MDLIIEEMDLTFTIDKITKSLKQENSLEDWSCRIFTYVLRILCNSLASQVKYQDMIHIARMKMAEQAKAQAEEQEVTPSIH